MTVEDLLRIVRSLPPEESAVAAVSRGLFYLDSRALAALLKELAKVGLSNRCVPARFLMQLISHGLPGFTYVLILQCSSMRSATISIQFTGLPEMRASVPGMALQMQCICLEKFQVIRWNPWQSTCRATFN